MNSLTYVGYLGDMGYLGGIENMEGYICMAGYKNRIYVEWSRRLNHTFTYTQPLQDYKDGPGLSTNATAWQDGKEGLVVFQARGDGRAGQVEWLAW